MAAADLSRSRAAASRSTKGLFFISTLLCLLCFVSSSIDEDYLDKFGHLEKFVKTSVRAAQELIQLQVMHPTDPVKTMEIVSDYIALFDQMLSNPEMKGFDAFISDDFPSLDTLMDCHRTYLKGLKAQVDRYTETNKGKKTEF